MSIPDLMMPEDLAAEPLHLQELKEGKTVRTERRFRRKDGTVVLTELTSKILPGGRLTISSYRSRLLEKMKMKNNAELTTYAIRNHLV
jgi:PAS domain S-box-containing protein